MKPYKNLKGKSQIVAYESGNGRLIIRFKNGAEHMYNASNVGGLNVSLMTDLAQAGVGLDTFLDRFVDKKLRLQLL